MDKILEVYEELYKAYENYEFDKVYDKLDELGELLRGGKFVEYTTDFSKEFKGDACRKTDKDY